MSSTIVLLKQAEITDFKKWSWLNIILDEGQPSQATKGLSQQQDYHRQPSQRFYQPASLKATLISGVLIVPELSMSFFL